MIDYEMVIPVLVDCITAMCPIAIFWGLGIRVAKAMVKVVTTGRLEI